jgi:protein O-mannosyl-transferase
VDEGARCYRRMKTKILAFHHPVWFIGLSALIYFQTLWFGFLRIDDDVNVFANPHYLNFSWSSLTQFWIAPYERLYIPVTYTLWAAIRGLEIGLGDGSFHAGVYHGANLILHALNGFLVYRIARKLLPSRESAALAAVLFIAHPFQVESVAWITSFRGLVSAFFGLGLVHYYVEQQGRLDSLKTFCTASILFLCALLSKPSAMGLLPMLLVLGWAFFPGTLRSQARFLLLWAVLCIPFVVLTKSEQPNALSGMVVSLWERPAVAADALSFYWTKAFFAWDFSLDYGRTPKYVLTHPGIIALGFCALTLLLVSRIKSASLRQKQWAFIAAFLLVLSPNCGWIPFEFQSYSTVADRYVYLAMLPFALFVANLYSPRWRAVALVALAGLTLQSIRMTSFWKNEFSLFTRTVEQNPKSIVGHNNLGFAYAQLGNWLKSAEHYGRAAAIQPGHRVVEENLRHAKDRIANGTALSESEALPSRGLAPRSAGLSSGL